MGCRDRLLFTQWLARILQQKAYERLDAPLTISVRKHRLATAASDEIEPVQALGRRGDGLDRHAGSGPNAGQRGFRWNGGIGALVDDT